MCFSIRLKSLWMLPPAMAVCILPYTDTNIFEDGIHGECLLIFLDTKSSITPKYRTNFLLFDAIRNDKTAKLIQLDLMVGTIDQTYRAQSTFPSVTEVCGAKCALRYAKLS